MRAVATRLCSGYGFLAEQCSKVFTHFPDTRKKKTNVSAGSTCFFFNSFERSTGIELCVDASAIHLCWRRPAFGVSLNSQHIIRRNSSWVPLKWLCFIGLRTAIGWIHIAIGQITVCLGWLWLYFQSVPPINYGPVNFNFKKHFCA